MTARLGVTSPVATPCGIPGRSDWMIAGLKPRAAIPATPPTPALSNSRREIATAT